MNQVLWARDMKKRLAYEATSIEALLFVYNKIHINIGSIGDFLSRVVKSLKLMFLEFSSLSMGNSSLFSRVQIQTHNF